MLKSLYITNLFGLYSYNLDFNITSDNTVTFITGPNGYGKTTILSLIDALYKYDFDYLLSVPFERLQYNFKDEIVRIKQVRTMLQDEGSDIVRDSNVTLQIQFHRTIDGVLLDDFIIDSKDVSWKQEGSSLRLYMQSLPLYYIKDQRLQHKTISLDKEKTDNETISAVRDNAADLEIKLKKIKEQFDVWKDGMYSQNGIENTTKGNLSQKFDMLSQWGILPKDFNSNIVAIPKKLERYIENIDAFIQKLNVFSQIIKRCNFSNKYIEISPRFGYRFIANDDDRTILSLDRLSSGEQHILIQTYELLFRAEEQSLVLIDEPELSLHLAWQFDFLRNIQDIIKARRIQCVIGTHSPQMFSSKWDLSIDLYEITHSQQEE